MNKMDSTTIDIVLLAISVLWVVFAFVYPMHKDGAIWFARSGAVMVLFAAIVEYRAISKHNKHISNRIQVAAITGAPVTSHKRKNQLIIDKIAHVYILLGTLIWAYGDLIK